MLFRRRQRRELQLPGENWTWSGSGFNSLGSWPGSEEKKHA